MRADASRAIGFNKRRIPGSCYKFKAKSTL